MLVQSLWHITPLKSEIRESELGGIAQHQLLIKSLYSLISLGTERLVCKGLVQQNMWDEMVVPYMEGEFGFPVKYGYSLVGEVLNGPPLYKGKLVHLLYPHQNYAVCNTIDAYIIPENIPPRRAVLASNMETAVNAVWDSYISVGDRILIAGFGLIGALTGIIMKHIPGVNVFVYDPDPSRISLAKDLGFPIYSGDSLNAGKFDIALNASASNDGLQLCIDRAGMESRIVELSWYGNKSVQLSLGGDFHKSRKQIISSQVSAIPALKQNRWTYRRRKELVFDLLKTNWFDKLLTHDVPFEESPLVFEKIRNEVTTPGIVINY
jgi:threonine dehydrogenase-like Zn-dependent dehydrogenase